MEEKKYLPLGSVVIVNGGVKKLMIVARAVATKYEGSMKNFDYGACLYPEGIVSQELMYFNHEDIRKVIVLGYKDEDDELMQENLLKWAEANGYKKANLKRAKQEVE